jgi:hypothetical protein
LTSFYKCYRFYNPTTINSYRGERGEMGVNIGPPRQILKDFLIKIKIKPKIGEPQDTPRNFGKNLSYPVPWIFNPNASMTNTIITST